VAVVAEGPNPAVVDGHGGQPLPGVVEEEAAALANLEPLRAYLARCIRNADSVPVSNALRVVRRWQAAIVLPHLQRLAELARTLGPNESDAARALLAFLHSEGMGPARAADYWVHAGAAIAELERSLAAAAATATPGANEEHARDNAYATALTALAALDARSLQERTLACVYRRPDMAHEVARAVHRLRRHPAALAEPPPPPAFAAYREEVQLCLLAAARGNSRAERPGRQSYARRGDCALPAVRRMVSVCHFLARQEPEAACPLLQAVCGSIGTLRTTTFWTHCGTDDLLAAAAAARTLLPLRLRARVPDPAAARPSDPWGSAAAVP